MVHVIAILTAAAGKRGDLLAALNAIRPAVLEEKGCREYVATIDHSNKAAVRAEVGPDTIVIVETWETIEDLEAHRAGEPLKEFGARIQGLVEKRTVHVLMEA